MTTDDMIMNVRLVKPAVQLLSLPISNDIDLQSNKLLDPSNFKVASLPYLYTH